MTTEIITTLIDITEPEAVEIQIRWDGQVIWINVNGLCRLRVCRPKHLVINDGRKLDEEITTT